MVNLRPQGFVRPNQNLVFDEINHTDEGVFFAEGELNRGGVSGEARTHRADTVIEVGAHAIHLVDESDARHVVAVRLAPDGFGLGLNAGDGVENGHRAIQHPQGALNLDGEVHVPGRVNDVDAMLLVEARPEAGGGGGSDGDAALALLLHPIHDGGAVVHLADFVADPGVEKDALGRSCLAGVDVRHDPDVAQFSQRYDPRHNLSLFPFSTGFLPRTPESRKLRERNAEPPVGHRLN